MKIKMLAYCLLDELRRMCGILNGMGVERIERRCYFNMQHTMIINDTQNVLGILPFVC